MDAVGRPGRWILEKRDRDLGFAARNRGQILLLLIFVGGALDSAFPTAGGLYYWAAKLAPGKSGPVWSWFTGWFNLLGQVAVTAGITFGCGYSIGDFIYLDRGERELDRQPPRGGLTASLLALQGLINTFGVNIVSLFNSGLRLVAPHRRCRIVVLILSRASLARHQSAGLPLWFGRLPTRSRACRDSPPALRPPARICSSLNTPSPGMTRRLTSPKDADAAIWGPKGIVSSIWVSWIAGLFC